MRVQGWLLQRRMDFSVARREIRAELAGGQKGGGGNIWRSVNVRPTYQRSR